MHSCDIFFYETAQKVGINKIAEVARSFGLGKKVNVGLENEKAGLIPDTEWKWQRFGEGWQQGENLISGIGQGYILTTPIQLATMTARIANGGYEVVPTFKKADPAQQLNWRKINVSSANLGLVKQGMCDVVNVPGGTAYMSRFDFNGQQMCGKTGSAQVRRITMKERESGIIKQKDLPWKFRDHALFVAYAPAVDPKYAVGVVVEHGGSGSGVAAPIGKNLLLEALKLDATSEPVE